MRSIANFVESCLSWKFPISDCCIRWLLFVMHSVDSNLVQQIMGLDEIPRKPIALKKFS